MTTNRSIGRITTAAFTIGAVSLGALGIVGHGGSEAQALTSVNNGSLTWSIKDSFMKYLATPVSAGKVTGTGGATTTGGKIHLPVAELPQAAGNDVTIPLKGAVDIKAHPGLGPTGYGLDLQYSDFALHFNGTKGELLADFTVNGTTGKGFGETINNKHGDNVVLATFDLTAPISKQDKIDSTTTRMFAGQGATDSLLQYEVGQELSPANIQINTGNNTAPSANGSDDLKNGPLGSLYNPLADGFSRLLSMIINFLASLGVHL